MLHRLLCMAALFGLAGCGGTVDPMVDGDGGVNPRADASDYVPPGDPRNPADLIEAGLYLDPATETFAPGVREFFPKIELWTDGSLKRRWILMPAGKQINTANMDDWNFPVGTRFFKEFARDGKRLETRYLYKYGPFNYEWDMRTYKWNQADTAATLLVGGENNVLGTTHDIPSEQICGECHDKAQSRVIGFSAIQLDYDAGNLLDLDDLVKGNELSNAPAGDAPYFPVPGPDQNTKDALVYLHANCGNCHNESADTALLLGVNLRLETARLGSVDFTGAYELIDKSPVTNIGGGITAVIASGAPDKSMLYRRMELRDDPDQMPKYGTELPDINDGNDATPNGLPIISDWISGL